MNAACGIGPANIFASAYPKPEENMPRKNALLATIDSEIADLEEQIRPLTIRVDVLNSLRSRIATSKPKTPAKRPSRSVPTPTVVE